MKFSSLCVSAEQHLSDTSNMSWGLILRGAWWPCTHARSVWCQTQGSPGCCLVNREPALKKAELDSAIIRGEKPAGHIHTDPRMNFSHVRSISLSAVNFPCALQIYLRAREIRKDDADWLHMSQHRLRMHFNNAQHHKQTRLNGRCQYIMTGMSSDKKNAEKQTNSNVISSDVLHQLPSLAELVVSRSLPRLWAMCPFLQGIQIFLSGFCVSSRGKVSNLNSSLSNILDVGSLMISTKSDSETVGSSSDSPLMQARGGMDTLSAEKQQFLITVTTTYSAQQKVTGAKQGAGYRMWLCLPSSSAVLFHLT